MRNQRIGAALPDATREARSIVGDLRRELTYGARLAEIIEEADPSDRAALRRIINRAHGARTDLETAARAAGDA